MTLDLFFVVRMKDGEVLFATHGPFTEEYPALVAVGQQTGSRCYSAVAKVTLPCELLEIYE